MVKTAWTQVSGKMAALLCSLTVLVVLLAIGCTAGSEPNEVSETSMGQGRALYGQLCQSCHGDAVTGAGGDPTIPPHGPQGHTWHHADGQLEAIILGEFTYPGRTMPSFDSELNKEEIGAILAYFKEGWTPEQRERQLEVSKNWEQMRGDSP